MTTCFRPPQAMFVEIVDGRIFIEITPPTPARKLNLQFLGGTSRCNAILHRPKLGPKDFNWPRLENDGPLFSRLSLPDETGLRKTEVLASLEPQEQYLLEVRSDSGLLSEPLGISHVSALYTDLKGMSRTLGIVAIC